jgi:hypothetical protein
MKNPMKQLSEYLPMVMEERGEQETEIISELLHCAKHLRNEKDAEIALIAAFFFLCDGSESRNRNSGLSSILPVVAAMLEAVKQSPINSFEQTL